MSVFVCLFVSGPIVKTTKVKISSQESGVDLNDPAVLDEILKQVSLSGV